MPSDLSIECHHPDGKTVSNVETDAWELKASRRGLLNLKTLLYGQPMHDLLKTQLEEADAFYKQLILDFNGEYKESRIYLKAKNFKSSYFMDWQKQIAEVMKSEEVKRDFFLKSVATAHPEHYAMPAYPAGIIETIGEHVARVQVRPDLSVPDFVKAYGDPSYVSIPVTGLMDDDTVLFYVLHEFRDAEDGSGCDIILRLLFPAAAP
ncbi:hypothetical protein CEP53_005798 [Fusarium sp. AF-6]|nr:hypothetical protein CEP53_005798 [Fusarium sp. AF-6]